MFYFRGGFFQSAYSRNRRTNVELLSNDYECKSLAAAVGTSPAGGKVAYHARFIWHQVVSLSFFPSLDVFSFIRYLVKRLTEAASGRTHAGARRKRARGHGGEGNAGTFQRVQKLTAGENKTERALLRRRWRGR